MRNKIQVRERISGEKESKSRGKEACCVAESPQKCNAYNKLVRGWGMDGPLTKIYA